MCPLSRRHRKAAIQLRDVVLAQKAIGFLQRANPRQPQFLRQPPLPSPEVAFHAPPRLRQVGRDHLNPQLAERPPHLRQPSWVNGAAGLGRLEEVAGAVAVERAKSPLPRDHLAQRRHHRARRFLLHQLRIADLAGGIVQHHDQVVPAGVLKPAMATAVQMQQHPRQRAPRPWLAMHPTLAALLDQPRPLQRQLHPGVAELEALLLAQLLVKMAHVEVGVLLLVEPQDLFHRGERHALRAGLTSPPVEQPVVAVLLVAPPPAPHAAHRNPQKSPLPATK